MNRQRMESYFSNSDHSYEQSYSWLLTFIECLLHAGLSAVLFMCLTSHNIPVRELFWIAPVPRCGKWVLGSVTWLGPGKSKGRTGIWNQHLFLSTYHYHHLGGWWDALKTIPGLSKFTWFFSNILEPVKRAFGKANLSCLQKNSREPCYMTNLDSILKNRDITLTTKVHLVKAVVFSLVMYGCESWIIKKTEHWRADVFELVCKTLESPLDSNEIKPVNPKRNQPWIFIGRTDAKTEAPILWPPDMKSPLIGQCWERLRLGGEGSDRGWDGWMTSLIQ